MQFLFSSSFGVHNGVHCTRSRGWVSIWQQKRMLSIQSIPDSSAALSHWNGSCARSIPDHLSFMLETPDISLTSWVHNMLCHFFLCLCAVVLLLWSKHDFSENDCKLSSNQKPECFFGQMFPHSFLQQGRGDLFSFTPHAQNSTSLFSNTNPLLFDLFLIFFTKPAIMLAMWKWVRVLQFLHSSEPPNKTRNEEIIVLSQDLIHRPWQHNWVKWCSPGKQSIDISKVVVTPILLSRRGGTEAFCHALVRREMVKGVISGELWISCAYYFFSKIRVSQNNVGALR